MKIVFMGTPELAVPALEKLNSSDHEIIMVVTQPDKVSGRGMKVTFSPVKQFALDNGLPLMQPEIIGEESVLDELEKLNADLFAVVAYAQKLPERLLKMAAYGCINLHPSLLPLYRGSQPLRGPILNGDKESGVSIIKLVEKWDAGDILLQKKIELDEKETAVTLEEKAVLLGAEMMLDVVNGLAAGTITPVPQDESRATYLKQIKKEDGLLDFSGDAAAIERKIRGFIPWPGAFTYMNGKLLKIFEADAVYGHEKGDIKPGTVVEVGKDFFAVRCKKGCLVIKDVQQEGKKRMPAGDFIRGSRIAEGDVLGL